MNKKVVLRILATAIVLTVIVYIFHSIFAFVGMKYYLMEEYFPVWSKLTMPTAGPPPMSFTFYSLGFGFVGWVLFTGGYLLVRKSIPGKTLIKKGLAYGLFIFLVGAIPGYLAMILLINLPLTLVVLWMFESLVINLVSGIVVAKMNK